MNTVEYNSTLVRNFLYDECGHKITDDKYSTCVKNKEKILVPATQPHKRKKSTMAL